MSLQAEELGRALAAAKEERIENEAALEMLTRQVIVRDSSAALTSHTSHGSVIHITQVV